MSCAKHSRQAEHLPSGGGGEGITPQYLAFCISCHSALCIECLFEHDKSHLYKKLEVLREEWLRNIVRLREELRACEGVLFARHVEASRCIEHGCKQIQQCRQEVLKLVDQHFSELEEQYIQCVSALTQQHLRENADDSDDMLSLDELNQGVQELESYQNYLQSEAGAQRHQLVLFFQDETVVKNLARFEKYLRCQREDLLAIVDKDQVLVLVNPEDTKDKQIVKIKFFTKPRDCRYFSRQNGQIVLIGGEDTSTQRLSRNVLAYDSRHRNMRALHPLTEEVKDFAMLYEHDAMGKQEFVYLLGGVTYTRSAPPAEDLHTVLPKTRISNHCYRYDLGTESVQRLEDLNLRRRGSSVLLCGRQLYVFGGVVVTVRKKQTFKHTSSSTHLSKNATNEQEEEAAAEEKSYDETQSQIERYDLVRGGWLLLNVLNSRNYISFERPALLYAAERDTIVIFGGGNRRAENHLQYFMGTQDFQELHLAHSIVEVLAEQEEREQQQLYSAARSTPYEFAGGVLQTVQHSVQVDGQPMFQGIFEARIPLTNSRELRSPDSQHRLETLQQAIGVLVFDLNRKKYSLHFETLT